MTQTHRFQGVARAISTVAGVRRYTYHSTAVVQVNPDGSIVLDSGGWKTSTTKNAMNQASNQDRLGFRVFAKDFEWFVNWRGNALPFENGMRLS